MATAPLSVKVRESGIIDLPIEPCAARKACGARAQRPDSHRRLIDIRSNKRGARAINGDFTRIAGGRLSFEVIVSRMRELAFGIEPNLAPEIAPSLAKGKILAEIRSRVLVDHRLEKCVVLAAFGV